MSSKLFRDRLVPAAALLVPLLTVGPPTAQAQPQPAASVPARAQARPGPTDPRAEVPPAPYRSVLKPLASSADAAVPWTQANRTVDQVGGWRAYAREAAGAPTAERPAAAGHDHGAAVPSAAAPAAAASPAASAHVHGATPATAATPGAAASAAGHDHSAMHERMHGPGHAAKKDSMKHSKHPRLGAKPGAAASSAAPSAAPSNTHDHSSGARP